MFTFVLGFATIYFKLYGHQTYIPPVKLVKAL